MSGNDTPTYLTRRQLAAQTGLSLATIHRLKAEGRIPYHQPAGRNGKVLFPPDALERANEDAGEPTSSSAGGSARPSGPRPRWERNIN